MILISYFANSVSKLFINELSIWDICMEYMHGIYADIKTICPLNIYVVHI